MSKTAIEMGAGVWLDGERCKRVEIEMEREKETEGERRIQSDASHTKPNRDRSVSVATVEKLIARAFFFSLRGGLVLEGGGAALPASVPHCSAQLCLSAPPAGPCVASVCCDGEGAVNQQLARYRPAIEAAQLGPTPPLYFFPLLSTSATTTPP